jgi:hypothetical protein
VRGVDVKSREMDLVVCSYWRFNKTHFPKYLWHVEKLGLEHHRSCGPAADRDTPVIIARFKFDRCYKLMGKTAIYVSLMLLHPKLRK